LVDEAPVEVEALLIRLAGSLREDPRPRDREPVGVRADLAHQRDVFLVAVVVVVGDVAVLVVVDVSRRVGERVPDRRALAVLVPGAFDLVRRRGDAPVEPVRKPARHWGLRLTRDRGHFTPPVAASLATASEDRPHPVGVNRLERSPLLWLFRTED